MALTKDRIVRAAVELLGEAGLEGLTLRALADRLGVAAPTLYWHVRNKQHLLGLVSDALLRSTATAGYDEPRPGEPWGDWLAARYRYLRGALLAHRDGALVVASNRPTAAIADHVERTLTTLVDVGFTPPEALRCLLALSAYAVADALETQRAQDHEPERGETTERRPPQVDREAHPHLADAVRGLGDEYDRFEEGLSLMIAGMRARLAERPAVPAVPAGPAGAASAATAPAPVPARPAPAGPAGPAAAADPAPADAGPAPALPAR